MGIGNPWTGSVFCPVVLFYFSFGLPFFRVADKAAAATHGHALLFYPEFIYVLPLVGGVAYWTAHQITPRMALTLVIKFK
jgi:hypothetical protein